MNEYKSKLIVNNEFNYFVKPTLEKKPHSNE